jgi:tRNA nucleotidyltransferase (CCA-adding enzyme)
MTEAQVELKTDFETFLREIRPTDNQRGDLQTGHQTLRDRLHDDTDLEDVVVSDFLQGSYRRGTAIRPKGGKRSDVDIIVVTSLSEADHTPTEAMNVFGTFLDRYYEVKWKPQGR